MKLTADDSRTRSVDMVSQNIEHLKALFPEVFVDGIVNIDVLKQILGATSDESDERFGLSWHGKRKARQMALTPSLGTLRPCLADSAEWNTTRNLVIEGDNLEVLKLLQKSYAGKVKLIYMDPPYNTGKDFVYPDDFQDNLRNYLQRTRQVDAANRKVSTNTEASGRYHTDWLNMMYPRLKLARSLLHDEGAIFVSCDDCEAANLCVLMNEVFGEETFVAQFVWKARKFTDARATTNISTDHEYILCYSKTAEFTMRGIGRDETKFSNPDGDPRGDWMSRSILGLATKEQRPNLHYAIKDPATGRVFEPNAATGWRYSRERMDDLIREGRILFPRKDDGRPREKKFRNEMQSEFIAFRTIVDDVHTADGTAEVRSLFGSEVFSFPKPVELIQKIVDQVAGSADIVLDCFAGSGSTGHAVMQQNVLDDGGRRYILIQLPEPLSEEARDQRVAAEFCDQLGRPRTIAELTKERLRRAAKRIRDEAPLFRGDLGFRVFKLDSSNIRSWEPDQANLERSIAEVVDHLKADRTEADILYELLLKLGLDLCVPIEQKKIAGKTVHCIGSGVLMVCLDTAITADEVEPLVQGIVGWRKSLSPAGDSTCVFRDSAFFNDVIKSNLVATLVQHGFDEKHIRSL